MRQKTFIILLSLAALWLTAGCDNSGTTERIEEPVLQGYLYVNQPMSVRLIHTVPMDIAYYGNEVGIMGATVKIFEINGADTTTFELAEDTTRLPGTYSVADTVRSECHYAIRVETGERVITAETRKAAPPIRLDSCRIGTAHMTAFRDTTRWDTLRYNRPEQPYEIYWADDLDRYGKAILIENIEGDWFADERELSGQNGPMSSPIFIWTMLNNNSFEVPWIALNFEGRHRVRVLSCDEAAYKYFQTTFPAYADLQPESNVRGALGIFCAIDADTAYFYLDDPDN